MQPQVVINEVNWIYGYWSVVNKTDESDNFCSSIKIAFKALNPTFLTTQMNNTDYKFQ